jgi:mannosyltransferase
MKQDVAVFDRIAASGGGQTAVHPRTLALGLLALGLVLGAILRFQHLGLTDLSADEGASWASASASAVSAVVATEHRLDPGKLPLYDVMLHGWVRIFGDSVPAMRAMSAALGTIAIVMVFAAVREVCRSLGGQSGGAIGDLAGALAALAYAVNFMMVASDRTARMYPVAMNAELAQIFFVVRAQRRGGWLNYAGAAIFTAALVAANFTTSFLLLAEAFWFGCLLVAKAWRAPLEGLAIFRPGLAIAAGVALLGPLLPWVFASSHQAVAMGAISWIKMGSIAWPYQVLRNAAGGKILFCSFVMLGAFGIWRHWRTAPLAPGFFLIWTLAPIVGVTAVSYLIHPLEFPRYVLIAFVGMFGLAAFGAASLRPASAHLALAVTLVGLSFGRAHHVIQHPYEAAWREATDIAAAETAPGEPIAVFPQYCDNVVRYYVSPDRRGAVRGIDDCGPQRVLILSGRHILPADRIAAMEKCYPHMVRRLKLVEVRAR